MNTKNNVSVLHPENTVLRTEAEPPATAKTDVEQIRSLLLAPEREKIDTLQASLIDIQTKLDNPEIQAQNTSQILVDAILLKKSVDNELGEALKPLIEEQFQASTRDNPEVMAEALFPVLGPAVRKMIVSMLTPDSKSVQRGFKFEQLFVIDNETGIPLCHVTAENAHSQDADMVSGMLSAIQSFVKDAFSTKEFDNLNTLQLGDLSVWIEWGPSVSLAAVIRGAAPKASREAMQQLNESIHQDYTQELKNYNGDASALDNLKPELLAFLDNHDSRLKNRVKNLPSNIKRILTYSAAFIVALVLWTAYNTYDKYRWANYIDILDSTPGIVVTNHKRTLTGYQVNGLRDAISTDPLTLLKQTSIHAAKVDIQMQPFQSADPVFLIERLNRLLVPPAGVVLSLENDTLHISGSAPQQWQTDASRLARTLSGVNNLKFHNARSIKAGGQ